MSMNHEELMNALRRAQIEAAESVVINNLQSKGLVATPDSQCAHIWSETDEFNRVECLWCGSIRPAELRHEDDDGHNTKNNLTLDKQPEKDYREPQSYFTED